jgi:Haem-binding domain
MKNRLAKIIAILVGSGLVIFLLIQVIPYGKDHTNPAVVSEPNWDSQQTRELAQKACFDCHSNQTIWPWYSNIAPISWLVLNDVESGRRRMNFSDWQYSRSREQGEVGSVIREGEMPPLQYLVIHNNARLSSTEKQQLADGLTSTMSR